MALAIADRIRPIAQAKTEQGLQLLLFGPNRSGKTTFAASAGYVPEMSKVLLMATETGLASVTNVPNVDYVPIENRDELVEVIEYVESGDHPYRTIVLDSLSAAADILKDYTAEQMGVTDIPWNELSQYTDRVKTLVRTMIGWSLDPSRAYNIVLITMTREKKTKSGIVTAISPDLSPSLATGVLRHLDGIGYLSADEKGQRVLSFEQTDTLYAGYRQNRDGNGPRVPLTMVDPTMEQLYRAAKGDA